MTVEMVPIPADPGLVLLAPTDCPAPEEAKTTEDPTSTNKTQVCHFMLDIVSDLRLTLVVDFHSAIAILGTSCNNSRLHYQPGG